MSPACTGNRCTYNPLCPQRAQETGVPSYVSPACTGNRCTILCVCTGNRCTYNPLCHQRVQKTGVHTILCVTSVYRKQVSHPLCVYRKQVYHALCVQVTGVPSFVLPGCTGNTGVSSLTSHMSTENTGLLSSMSPVRVQETGAPSFITPVCTDNTGVPSSLSPVSYHKTQVYFLLVSSVHKQHRCTVLHVTCELSRNTGVLSSCLQCAQTTQHILHASCECTDPCHL